MRTKTAKPVRTSERGMALLLTLFALLLLSGIGLFLVVSSNTETRIDANYGSGLRAYYAARSGVEEVRDRMSYVTSLPDKPAGLADKLPLDIAGNAGGVLYVVNPAPGETVDPTDPTSPYFDDDLCHQYNSGTSKGVKCSTQPTIANWQLPAQLSLAGGQLTYKWIRINMKTNRSVLPSFCVDQQQDCTTAPLDTRVCWDGKTEQLSPGGVNVACDANGMQTVYMLTALAVSGGASGPGASRKLLQVESVASSIRPAGVVTAASMTASTSGNAVMPSLVIDGRAHKLDGTLVDRTQWTTPPSNICSDISALGTDTGAAQLESVLDQMRKNIVNLANNSCRADGSPINGNACTPGLWWVRGTDSSTRFVTTVSSSGSSGSSDGGSSGSTSGSDGGDHGGSSSTTCNATTPNCYNYLNLASPQLFGTSATTGLHVPTVTPTAGPAPFTGGSGNQSDSTIYQPKLTQTVADQISAVRNLMAASSSQQNTFTASSSTLSGTYGSSSNPVVLNFTDSTLSLPNGTQTSLTGYGVLVIPNALEINSGATFKWTGIVLINSPSGHMTVYPGARGFINGALLLTPGAVFNTPANGPVSGPPPFAIGYSCEAIDMVFSMQPFKVISASETSF